MRKARAAAPAAGLVLLLIVLSCSPAVARATTSSSQAQVAPGITQRTIWSQCQVGLYRLPTNVTHTGYIHVELKYTPADYDTFVYLLDEDAHVCAGTREEGRLGTWPGRESVDFQVSDVAHKELTPDGAVTGDVYYVMVQVLNATSRVQVTGYYPVIAPGETDTTDPQTLLRANLRVPSTSGSWTRLSGAPYGGPFDFTPTSQGTVYCRLEYPADVAKKTVGPIADPGDPLSPWMAANFEQYAYTADWEGDWKQNPLADADEDGLTHWDLLDAPNAHASSAPAPGGAWNGLEGTFAVARGGDYAPSSVYHYVPVLWMASSQPLLGPAAPATGTRTIGYKATLLIPQNLYLKSATATVKRGKKATISGTLAVPDGPAPDATVSWAPAGQPVAVQNKVHGAWKTLTTVPTVSAGAWQVKVKPRKTGQWRALWLGPWTAEVGVGKNGAEPVSGYARTGDQLPVADPVVTVASIGGAGVTFELLPGFTFTDSSTSVTVAAGDSATRTVQESGDVYTFAVTRAYAADEASLARTIKVR